MKLPRIGDFQKIKVSHLLTFVLVSCQFKRRVQESTQVLRELEISLRTNHIGSVTQMAHKLIFSCIQLSKCIQQLNLVYVGMQIF